MTLIEMEISHMHLIRTKPISKDSSRKVYKITENEATKKETVFRRHITIHSQYIEDQILLSIMHIVYIT